MRRAILGILGFLALLLCTSCGGEEVLGGRSNPGPSATAADGAWAAAQKTIATLNAGAYEASLISQRCSKATTADCRLTSRTIHNDGSFSLKPLQVTSELVVDQPANESAADAGVIQMRAVRDGSLFLLDPATSTCWQQLDRGFASTFDGPVRNGLAVLRSAKVSYDLPASGSNVEMAAQANALDVIRTLGLPESLDTTYGITEETRKALAGQTVSIAVKVGRGGSQISFEVDGRQVAAEIHSGAIGGATAFVATVQNAWSTFTVRDFGKVPEVSAPPADQVQTTQGPCAAAG